MFRMLALTLTLATLAPPDCVQASDAWRFPYTLDQARRGYEVATRHVDWMRQHSPCNQEWIDDAEFRRRCWDLLDDCRRIHPFDTSACRRKLSELRRLLGPEMYWRGVLPDYLPAERFYERP